MSKVGSRRVAIQMRASSKGLGSDFTTTKQEQLYSWSRRLPPRQVTSTSCASSSITTRIEEFAKEIAASCRERAATLGQDVTLRQNPVKNRLELQRRLLITRNTRRANRYAESASILENTRLAGHSYKRWVLKDYMALLRVRSLLSRGRARHGPETTVVAARLFGSLSGFADVPNECFWRVVEYAWLGDWRHP